MADELQKTYREYGKRKRSAFRASVKKAYSIVLRSYGVDDKDSSDEELLSDSDADSEEDKFVSSTSRERWRCFTNAPWWWFFFIGWKLPKQHLEWYVPKTGVAISQTEDHG